jgi:Zn-finger nucleic acid-binding protein
MAAMNCPRCNDVLEAGELPHCPHCAGSWISVAAIGEHVARAQHTPRPKLDWQSDPRDAIACLECGKPMETLKLFAVPVDRCAPHGVWLDREELDAIVKHAGTGEGRGFVGAILDAFWMWG